MSTQNHYATEAELIESCTRLLNQGKFIKAAALYNGVWGATVE